MTIRQLKTAIDKFVEDHHNHLQDEDVIVSDQNGTIIVLEGGVVGFKYLNSDDDTFHDESDLDEPDRSEYDDNEEWEAERRRIDDLSSACVKVIVIK